MLLPPKVVVMDPHCISHFSSNPFYLNVIFWPCTTTLLVLVCILPSICIRNSHSILCHFFCKLKKPFAICLDYSRNFRVTCVLHSSHVYPLLCILEPCLYIGTWAVLISHHSIALPHLISALPYILTLWLSPASSLALLSLTGNWLFIFQSRKHSFVAVRRSVTVRFNSVLFYVFLFLPALYNFPKAVKLCSPHNIRYFHLTFVNGKSSLDFFVWLILSLFVTEF